MANHARTLMAPTGGSRENVFYPGGMDADALGHPVIDADNHYYEAEDAFTRHLDPALGPRCVQWATIDGKRYHVLGGRVSRAVSNATFDPVSKPGCLYDYFRGNAPASTRCRGSATTSRSDPSTATPTPGSARSMTRAWPAAGCSRPSA